MQLSAAALNAQLAAVISLIGVGVLKVFNGTKPANCAAADAGTKLGQITLPSPAFGTPSGGTVGLTGTWAETSADATGTPTYFRIYDSSGTNCIMQGTAGVGSGELSLNGTFTAGQPFSVTSFSFSNTANL